MWEAAGFLGMSEKTLRETYGHHHPDHLRGAAEAIGSRPEPKRNVGLVVSLVEEKAKRAEAAKTLDFTGGPGRTRTCNQTVMSDGITIGFVDVAVFLPQSDRARCASVGSFLVRNWCGHVRSCRRDGIDICTLFAGRPYTARSWRAVRNPDASSSSESRRI
jgi:hypothetical protein